MHAWASGLFPVWWLRQFGSIFGGVTASGGPDPGVLSGREADELAAEAATPNGDSDGRRLIATAVGVETPTVRMLAEWLLGPDRALLDRILEAGLSSPDRLEAVRNTGLLDDTTHPAMDRIAQLTAQALKAPFASVALVLSDRQILVGCNVEESQYPRSCALEMSVSKFAVVSGEPLIINDATLHPLLAGNPAVQAGAQRAFAGIPLMDGRGNAVGTLSAWDGGPHQWTNGQIQILNDLAAVASAHVFAASAGDPPVSRASGKRKGVRGMFLRERR